MTPLRKLICWWRGHRLKTERFVTVDFASYLDGVENCWEIDKCARCGERLGTPRVATTPRHGIVGKIDRSPETRKLFLSASNANTAWFGGNRRGGMTDVFAGQDPKLVKALMDGDWDVEGE